MLLPPPAPPRTLPHVTMTIATEDDIVDSAVPTTGSRGGDSAPHAPAAWAYRARLLRAEGGRHASHSSTASAVSHVSTALYARVMTCRRGTQHHVLVKCAPPPRKVLTRHAETSTRNLQDGARFITAAASRRPIEFLELGEVESVHSSSSSSSLFTLTETDKN